ncbi:MAG TPA: SIR2 family protein [Tepidisphaeraceae bacterium]|nr:SIR2 family protein [Tepidisphaeraceae bacterium]
MMDKSHHAKGRRAGIRASQHAAAHGAPGVPQNSEQNPVGSVDGGAGPPGRFTGSMLSRSLRDKIVSRRCVAYVGAGFSAACGMPGWKQLLNEMCKYARDNLAQRVEDKRLDIIQAVEDAAGRNQFLLAASLLRKVMDRAELGDVVRSHFDNTIFERSRKEIRDRMKARIEHLVRGPWVGLVTTNYDTLIEWGLNQFAIPHTISLGTDPNLGTVLSSPTSRTFFVKVHGSIAGGEYVLSTEEYDRTYLGTPRMSSFLAALMLSYHVVFIGCSLEDDIVRIRRKMMQDFDRTIPKAYAVLKNSNSQWRDWLSESAGIEIIPYPDDDHDHISLDAFLEESRRSRDAFVDGAEGSEEGDATRSRLLSLVVDKRIGEIGLVNLNLLSIIANCMDARISQQRLMTDNTIKQLLIRPGGDAVSGDETVYRALFLVSIRLLKEVFDQSGEIGFVAPPEVIQAVRHRKDAVSNPQE